MKINFKRASLILCSCLVLGFLYSMFTTKYYQAESQIMIQRQKIDVEEIGSEESRNRWIWIRDGLNIKNLLTNDETLAEFIKNQKINLSKGNIRNMIDITYSGADDNLYIIKVKSNDKDIAKKLIEHLTSRLKFLSTENIKNEYDLIINNLKLESQNVPDSSKTYMYFQNQIAKLNLAKSMDSSLKKNTFQVIINPFVNDQPIWPKIPFILMLSLIIGIIISLGFEITERK